MNDVIEESRMEKNQVRFVSEANGIRLGECVRISVEEFFQTMDGHGTNNLFEFVMAEVEKPLLETVLRLTRGNQTKASELLGLNRGTLRKKLREHGLS